MVNKMVSWEQATKLFIIDLEKIKKEKKKLKKNPLVSCLLFAGII